MITTVPPQDPDAVYGQAALKLVVLGNNRENLVNLAESVTPNPPMGVVRHVIWLKNPDPTQLAAQFPGLPADFSGIKAFSLSTINKVAYQMPVNELEDEVAVEDAFIKAGKTKFNQP